MKTRIRFNRGNIRTWLIVAGCLLAAPSTISFIIGWLMLIPGAILHLWSKACLKQNQEVTATGPYRWTRNPFYVGNLLIDLGICIVINQVWLTVIFIPLWFVVYRWQIQEEEKHLEELFGESYRAYKASIPRFWPRLTPAKGLSAGEGFSWNNPNLIWGSEYGRLLRIFYSPLLIWICREVYWHRWELFRVHHSLIPSGLALLGILILIEWGVIRRFKRGKQLMPAIFQSWPAQILVLLVTGILLFSTRIFETEHDCLLFPIGLVLLLFTFIALALQKSDGLSPAMIRWGEAMACLLGGIVGEVPWLGLLGFGYFAILAIDATRTLNILVVHEEHSPRALPFGLQRAFVLVVLLVFGAMGPVKHYVSEGKWPLLNSDCMNSTERP